MHVNGRQNIDDLIARMEKVRGRLDRDAQAARQSVHEMTDWKNLVRKNPLTTMAVAVLAGYLLVPRKRNTTELKASDLERLARDHKIIVAKEAAPQATLMGTVTALAGAALARAATNFIVNKVTDLSQANEQETR